MLTVLDLRQAATVGRRLSGLPEWSSRDVLRRAKGSGCARVEPAPERQGGAQVTRKDSLSHTLALVAVAALGALLAWIGRGRR